MDPDYLKQRIITMGKASVLANETEDYIIRGALLGFDLCQALHTPEDFVRALSERNQYENTLFDLVHKGKARSEDYKEYRCATLQIDFVFQRMQVLWGGQVLYASAIVQVLQIMAEWQKALCN